MAFEPSNNTSLQKTSNPHNTLIFLSGLTDGFLTIPYFTTLLRVLPSSYSLVHPLLSSCYSGWGISSLDQDVEEIAPCVEYFKKTRPGGKIVLMGHSTGCQDVMHYLTSPGANDRPKVNGAILQAPVSDREAIQMMMDSDAYDASVKTASDFVEMGCGDDCLPLSLTKGFIPKTPVSAKRWLSLTSPAPGHLGEDDYFSSDLGTERLAGSFGRVGAMGVPLCIVFSGNDEGVPASVDKEGLVKSWTNVVKETGGVISEGSGVVPGASHNLNGNPEEVVDDMLNRVRKLLDEIEGTNPASKV